MAEKGGFARSLAVGAILGLLVVTVAVVAVVAGTGSQGWFAETEPPGEVLVIALTNDADGASVAGVIARVAPDGQAEVLDPFMEVDIPGTSYSALRDASAFGGGQAVADAYAGATGAEEPPAWVVMRSEVWQGLVDDAGGAAVDVPAAANVFLNDELYMIEAGEQTLSGVEVGALVATERAADAAAAAGVNAAVGRAWGVVVTGAWADVVAAVEAGDASSSVDGELLGEFGSGFGSQ